MTAQENKPKQVKLTKRTAAAMQANIQQINSLSAVAQGAQLAAEAAVQVARKAQEQVQAAATTHQSHLTALIEDAGFKPEEFANYGIFEENGEFYLRANAAQQVVQ